MYEAVAKELPLATIFVGAAAVADYAPANAAEGKIKKDGRDFGDPEFEENAGYFI